MQPKSIDAVVNQSEFGIRAVDVETSPAGRPTAFDGRQQTPPFASQSSSPAAAAAAAAAASLVAITTPLSVTRARTVAGPRLGSDSRLSHVHALGSRPTIGYT